MADPEKLLRELWDGQGVPKEKQDEIIRDIEEKAKQFRAENLKK